MSALEDSVREGVSLLAELAARFRGERPHDRQATAELIAATHKTAQAIAEQPLDPICTKPGPCPCPEPCQWGLQAIEELRQHGWPEQPTKPKPPAA